jgi:hypothetical protein
VEGCAVAADSILQGFNPIALLLISVIRVHQW